MLNLPAGIPVDRLLSEKALDLYHLSKSWLEIRAV